MPPSDDQCPKELARGTAVPSPSLPPLPPLPPEPATQRRAVAALFLALLSLAGLLGVNDLQRGVYIVLYALLAGGIAVWLALTAIGRARRGHTARPRGSVTATVIAGLGICLSGLMLVAFVVLGKQLSDYARCLSGANTIAAQQACQHQFTRAVSHKITLLGMMPGR